MKLENFTSDLDNFATGFVFKLSLQELIDFLDLPDSLESLNKLFKNATFSLSYECIQDQYLYPKNLFSIKTPEFTENEIEDWTRYDDYFESLNLNEARKRVNFIRNPNEEPPYYDYNDET